MILSLWLLGMGTAKAEHCWEPKTGAGRRAARRGAKAAEQGDLALAAEHLRASLAAEPNCGAVQQRLGAVLLETGDLDEARTQLASAMARFPEEPDGLLLLARVAVRQSDQASARMLARQALALAPGELDALMLTHDILRREGAWSAIDTMLEQHAVHHALADIACLASMSEFDRGALEPGHQALATCQEGGQAALVAAAQAHVSGTVHGVMTSDVEALQQINAAIAAEDWAGALAQIDRVVQPLELSVRVVRATCLYNLARQDEALVDLQIALSGGERLLRNDPTRAAFYTEQLRSAARMQARILAGQSRTDEALSALQDARDRFGQDYDLHRTEIYLLVRSDQPLQAAGVWMDAARRWPSEADLFGAMADIIQTDRSVVTSEMWNFLGRSSAPADQFALAAHRLEEGDIAGCLFHAEQSLRLGAAGSDVANLSYHCAVRAGELELAAERRIQLGESVMPVLLLQHGLLAAHAGEHEQARAILEEACPRLRGEEQATCLAALGGL